MPRGRKPAAKVDAIKSADDKTQVFNDSSVGVPFPDQTFKVEAVVPPEAVDLDQAQLQVWRQQYPIAPIAANQRDISTGLRQGIAYVYDENGKINWRKMIDPKYLSIKKEKKEEIEAATGKAFENVTPDELEDKYLLLLLDGVKEVAKLRGFTTVRYVNKTATRDFVSTDCEITWIPNCEDPYPQTFTDGADASPDNVDGFYANYLTTAANNRAFVRSVRNFLGIYVVGKDEIGPDKDQPSSVKSSNEDKPGVEGFGPQAALANLLQQRNRTFAQLKKFLLSKDLPYSEDIEAWNDLSDIPKEKIFPILGLIKTATEPATQTEGADT